jgi:3-oxoacyl-[acyl-carrier protein] reductase
MKVAIVTGAGTGVGAATSLELARRGYSVVVQYRRSEAEAQDVVLKCEQLGVEAMRLKADVGADDDCRHVAALALDRWGRIDALVNCAGTTQFVLADRLDDLSIDDFMATYRTNTVGAFQMIRAVAPAMRTHGGAIVNISSVASVTGSGSSHAYVASKGALNSLTLGLARALAPAVRVNAVLPGMIEGRWMREGVGDTAYQRIKAEFSAQAALGRICTAGQIADAAAWLLDGATGVTGQLLVVDSGFLLGRSRTVTAE